MRLECNPLDCAPGQEVLAGQAVRRADQADFEVVGENIPALCVVRQHGAVLRLPPLERQHEVPDQVALNLCCRALDKRHGLPDDFHPAEPSNPCVVDVDDQVRGLTGEEDGEIPITPVRMRSCFITII